MHVIVLTGHLAADGPYIIIHKHNEQVALEHTNLSYDSRSHESVIGTLDTGNAVSRPGGLSAPARMPPVVAPPVASCRTRAGSLGAIEPLTRTAAARSLTVTAMCRVKWTDHS